MLQRQYLLEKTSIRSTYKLGDVEVDHTECEKDFGVMESRNLKPRKQCLRVRNKTNRLPGFISRTISNGININSLKNIEG